MKKLFLAPLLIPSVASVAFGAQIPITAMTGSTTNKYAERAATNSIFGDINTMFTELYATGGGDGISHATSDGGYYFSKDGAWSKTLGTFTGATIPDNSTLPEAIQALEIALEALPSLTIQTTPTTGANQVPASSYVLVSDTDADGLPNKVDLAAAGLVKTDSSGVMATATAGTDYVTPTGSETITSKTITGASYPTASSTTTATGNINIDGVSADHYYFNNGSTAASYTPVITSAPASGKERAVILTIGGGSGVCTLVATNITWLSGTAPTLITTTNKKLSFGRLIPSSGNAQCNAIGGAHD